MVKCNINFHSYFPGKANSIDPHLYLKVCSKVKEVTQGSVIDIIHDSQLMLKERELYDIHSLTEWLKIFPTFRA